MPAVGPQMYEHLEVLRSENEDCVIIVRGLAKMGFGSEELLCKHFAKFGTVERVLVAHPQCKVSKVPGDCSFRVRPARMGFVVMRSAGSVQHILKAGAEHTVANVRVHVEPYQHMEAKPAGDRPAEAQHGKPATTSAGQGVPSAPTKSDLCYDILARHAAATAWAEAAVAESAWQLKVAQDRLRALEMSTPWVVQSAGSLAGPPPGLQGESVGLTTENVRRHQSASLWGLPLSAGRVLRQPPGFEDPKAALMKEKPEPPTADCSAGGSENEAMYTPRGSSCATPVSHSRSTSVGGSGSEKGGFSPDSAGVARWNSCGCTLNRARAGK